MIADEWPLPTGGIVAEPDFFHLIGDSMVDKFRKVKHTGVIVWREFSGFWMAGRKSGLTDGTPGAGAGLARAIRLTMP